MTPNEKRGVCAFSTVPEKITCHLWRLCIPFEDIYTSVFVLLSEQGTAILDSGSSGMDAETYIVPLLQALDREPDFLLCSHLHGDHNGGTAWLLGRYPRAKAVLFSSVSPYAADRTVPAVEGEMLFERFRLLNLPGHTPDAMAVYDTVDKILLTQDCLQKRGITKYGFGVTDVAAYLASIEKVRTLAPDTIMAAHHFIPDGHMAHGKDEVERFLDTCTAVTKELGNFVSLYPAEGADVVAMRYREAYPDFPDIWGDRVETIRRWLEK